MTTEQLTSVTGGSGNVLTTSGDKIGSIGQVYVDDTTGDPTWVTAKTGLFGTSESFVPLEGASVQGSDILVNYDKDTVKDAPRVDADGALSPEEEETLYSHYGLSSSGGGYTSGTTTGGDSDYGVNSTDRDVVDRDRDFDRDGVDQVGHDTSGPTTDDAMTLSEERLNVGTQKREAGRARLRKYVVTENVTQTVPVSREEVRLEREPITDANIGDATSGPAISEEEHEVILHEERPVVEKEAAPVERVRLDTETVTEQATVSEDVRKEQVDTDVDGDRTNR
ncbi:MAG: PRC and DUF2382 domain-containing protein [Propionibacteriaceae bacterium]|nr:PRC and DUF2382 domain-containing protein [Propionibacteriaceae bacterium]